MASVRIDSKHQSVLDLLITSSRVSSTAGRARTGPFNEIRQVIVYAAALGATANRRRAVEGAGGTAVRDVTVLEAPGALELSFALTYRDRNWDLSVVAEGVAAADARIRILEEYAAGGFDILHERYEALGHSPSAADLLLDVNRVVPPLVAPEESSTPDEPIEDPLLAALRRRGKLKVDPASQSAD